MVKGGDKLDEIVDFYDCIPKDTVAEGKIVYWLVDFLVWVCKLKSIALNIKQ